MVGKKKKFSIVYRIRRKGLSKKHGVVILSWLLTPPKITTCARNKTQDRRMYRMFIKCLSKEVDNVYLRRLNLGVLCLSQRSFNKEVDNV